MKPIRITGILLTLALSLLLPVKTTGEIDLLYKQFFSDLEGVFVHNARALVPMFVGQLFLLFSLFIRSNLYIQSGLVAMALAFVFFLTRVYQQINTIQILIYMLFAVVGLLLFLWTRKDDKQ